MLSSVAAQLGGVIGPHYAASKAGMIGLVHSYTHMLAKEDITATICIGAAGNARGLRPENYLVPNSMPCGPTELQLTRRSDLRNSISATPGTQLDMLHPLNSRL